MFRLLLILLLFNTWTKAEFIESQLLNSTVPSFGQSLKLCGTEKLIVGAPLATVGNYSQLGTVFVYSKLSGGWQVIQQINYPNATSGVKQFGNSVSCSTDGTIIAIGCPLDTISSHYYSGSAYIWKLDNKTGLYSFSQRLNASIVVAYQLFGYSVAVSGDGSTVAVGSFAEYYGTVCVFANLSLLNCVGNVAVKGYFGSDVAVDHHGKVIAIAAYDQAAYIYKIQNGAAKLTQTIKTNDTQVEFAFSIALSGKAEWLAIGIPSGKIVNVYNGVTGAFVLTDILAENLEYFGYDVAFTYNGTVMAASAILTNYTGVVLMYVGEEGLYKVTQILQPAEYKNQQQMFGLAIDIGETANQCLIGAPFITSTYYFVLN